MPLNIERIPPKILKPHNTTTQQEITQLLDNCWKMYYQAKFQLFLLKSEITLTNDQTKVNTFEVDQPYMEIKWVKINNEEKYKEIDFQRYCHV